MGPANFPSNLSRMMLRSLLRILPIGLWILCLRAQARPDSPAPDFQPFAAQVRRLVEATDALGAPLPASDRARLESLLQQSGPDSVRQIEALLDPRCLLQVSINPEMRVKVTNGVAKPELYEGGWRTFLVKVQNDAGTTAKLKLTSPNTLTAFNSPAANVAQRWLEASLVDRPPVSATLTGLPLEYRILQLYSRDAGKRQASFSFNAGQGTQDLGFRAETDVLFDCLPAREVSLGIRDESGSPTTASLLITDANGHVYPSPGRRLAPDFFFHPQVYRADNEVLRLPEGRYAVAFQRGPESVLQKRELTVGPGPNRWDFRVVRWIDPAASGWWSGDHHIHAAGCAHYTNPTEGVHAPDMMRHCLGEDLKIGANLTWGPCFDYQKQFFTGFDDKVSQHPYLLRYDVEVSGFGSHQSGHLCLLRLKEQIYPGGDSKNHWPKLGLNTLRWAHRQGALCGPAHSGWGLQVNTSELPNLIVPPFDGIGANEYIVDVTHEVPGPEGRPVPAVDFLSMVDTPSVWELNIWYHTLNAGYRTRISGETDFPCIYGDKVGLGRSYVKLDGKLDYERWCEGIRSGRNYVGDGKSHLMDFAVNGAAMGVGASEVRLDRPGTVTVTARAAALLDETPHPEIQSRSYTEKPYWDVERARIGSTRDVPVEVLVNGKPVTRTTLKADGTLRDLQFSVPIERSSWVALRILPSSHTNPIWVLVDGKPVRASRKSVEWCLKGVEQCWSQKERFFTEPELTQARADYEHAREAYRKLLAETEAD